MSVSSCVYLLHKSTNLCGAHVDVVITKYCLSASFYVCLSVCLFKCLSINNSTNLCGANVYIVITDIFSHSKVCDLTIKPFSN